MLSGERRLPQTAAMNKRLIVTCRHIKLALLFAAGLILSPGLARAQDASAPDHRELIDNPAAIKRALNEQTVYGRYADGKIWTEYQSSDGRTAYEEDNCIYEGHWWVAAGQVCYRYEAMEDGKVFCFQLYHHGSRLEFDYELAPGDWQMNAYTIDVTPGNPEKLPLDKQGCRPAPGV